MDPLSNLETTNGKLESKVDLEELFGTKRTNPFGTNRLEDFEEILKNMAYADMQELGRRVGGIDIYASRPNLKLKLIEAFKFDSRNRQHMGPIVIRNQNRNDFDKSNPEHVAVMRSLGMRV
jgi:hypothetical protein